MKVGMDGVLLGAWTPINTEIQTILDIGTGSGLIALMLAQRAPSALIDAIDIDENAIRQAIFNIDASPWTDSIAIHHRAFSIYAHETDKRYDLIVSNPPYFVNSLKTPEESRNLARHTDSLNHQDLLLNAKSLLMKTGRICIILPVNEGLAAIEYANRIGIFCYQSVYVHPKLQAKAKRLLLEFGLEPLEHRTSSLYIESAVRHQYTTDYTTLVKDFYLKL